jgi:hypothetical protein
MRKEPSMGFGIAPAMRASLLAPALAVLLACDSPAPQPKVDYRPEEAGDVDHALCLLGFTAVPLRRAATTGHHLVEARVNGRAGLFVLDTGANMSVIDDDHVATFGLGAPAGVRGGGVAIGGAVTARLATIRSLEIGGIRLRQRQMVVADIGNLMAAMRPLAGGAVHGLIGQDVLNAHRAVIDMKRPALYLIAADRDPAPVRAERCRPGGGEAVANRSGNS